MEFNIKEKSLKKILVIEQKKHKKKGIIIKSHAT